MRSRRHEWLDPEGHGVREIAHAVDLIERSIAWYEKHF